MSIERADIAIRLVEERGRIGYSRVSFARELGISGETLRLYEIGKSALNAEVLAKAVALGVDVQYVLAGIRSNNVAEAERAAQPTVHQAHGGAGNVLHLANIHGGTFNVIHSPRDAPASNSPTKSAENYVSESQADQLSDLVHEVVDLEARFKAKPSSYRAVWAALNAHCSVTRYTQIASSDYPKAEKYLRQWITRLNALAPSPPADNKAWRTRKIAYIKINTKDDEVWLSTYLEKIRKDATLADLSDEDLDRTYRAVSARKRTRTR